MAKTHFIADGEGNMDPADLADLLEEFKGEIPEEKITEAAGAGELVALRTKAGPCMFRVPTGAEYDRFLGGLLGDNKEGKVKASKILATTCVVFPSREEFQAGIARYPGIPSACTRPLNKLMGGELVARGKD